eukprot:c44267_g1_i1 orf=251-475(-)
MAKITPKLGVIIPPTLKWRSVLTSQMLMKNHDQLQNLHTISSSHITFSHTNSLTSHKHKFPTPTPRLKLTHSQT